MLKYDSILRPYIIFWKYFIFFTKAWQINISNISNGVCDGFDLILCWFRNRLELMRHIYNEEPSSPVTPEQRMEDFFHCLNQPFTLANLVPSRLVVAITLLNIFPPLFLCFVSVLHFFCLFFYTCHAL